MTENNVTPLPATAGGFELTPEQAQSLARWAIESGQLTQQQADQMLGATPDSQAVGNAAPTFHAPDRPAPGNPADAAIDQRLAEIDYRPAQPHEYEMPPLTAAHEPMTDAIYEFDATARGWLSSAKLDASTGSAFATFASEAVTKWRGLSEPARDLHVAEQRAMLERMGYTAERLNRANAYIKTIDGGRLAQYLTRSGAGADGRIAAMWIDHFERMHGMAP